MTCLRLSSSLCLQALLDPKAHTSFNPIINSSDLPSAINSNPTSATSFSLMGNMAAQEPHPAAQGAPSQATQDGDKPVSLPLHFQLVYFHQRGRIGRNNFNYQGYALSNCSDTTRQQPRCATKPLFQMACAAQQRFFAALSKAHTQRILSSLLAQRTLTFSCQCVYLNSPICTSSQSYRDLWRKVISWKHISPLPLIHSYPCLRDMTHQIRYPYTESPSI